MLQTHMAKEEKTTETEQYFLSESSSLGHVGKQTINCHFGTNVIIIVTGVNRNPRNRYTGCASFWNKMASSSSSSLLKTSNIETWFAFFSILGKIFYRIMAWIV
mmetsp:Transcript_16688/g.21200  ORF Transcript_16688/g.21200 Transcript_16688/m.21200 type:complete len:104 (+) Transcript_16688:160-471(+)